MARRTGFFQLTLELPFPPSVNQYWRNAGRTLLSEQVRSYHRQAQALIAIQLAGMQPRFEPFYRPVAVDILLTPPDRRRRDLDNFLKALLDSLTRAKVWTDDCLARDLHVAWDRPRAPGGVVLTIWPQPGLEA